MAGEIIVTVVGNLTADPDHRVLTSGQVVANLTVAQNSRVYDRASNEWRDGAAAFMRCVVWNEMADHVAETLIIWSPEDENALKQLLSDVDMSFTSKEA